MSTQRLVYLDYIAGILVLFMVYHHACPDSAIQLFLNRLLFFYMPWFFFKAGMFYNPNKDLKTTFVVSIKRLILPYIIFLIIGQVVIGLRLYLDGDLHINIITRTISDIIKLGSSYGNSPLWFLFSLFFVRLIFASIKGSLSSIICITVIGLFGAYLSYNLEIKTPLYLGNILLGAFFYGLGYLMNLLKKTNKLSVILSIVCLMIYLLTISTFPVIGSFVNNSSDNYFWYISSSIAAIIAYNYVFSNMRLPNLLLSFSGKHSLEILVVHHPIINILKMFIM